MLYLNKFLNAIKKDSQIFKRKNIVNILGITFTEIKKLKKYALENELIIQNKKGIFLSDLGEQYLTQNPFINWDIEKYNLRPRINVEYFKEEKCSPVLKKAIRNLAKHLIEQEEIKQFSLEEALIEDIKNCENLILIIQKEILNGNEINLKILYDKYLKLGLTKSIISICILKILVNNIEKIAIYEKSQFQLNFNCLMFDRMFACPEHFEFKKTEMSEEFILKDISKIILNNKSTNILEITKGLFATIKRLDKYTLNTQNLTKETLRLRNILLNAKDPIILFKKDIPQVYGYKTIKDCDRKFLENFKKSLSELKNCSEDLLIELKQIILKTFHSQSKKELAERFLHAKNYIGENELKILFRNIINLGMSDELWTNRIATFINKYRVPKDWHDEDFANFKLKICELATRFFIIEATVGVSGKFAGKDFEILMNKYLSLTRQEQLLFLRKVAN